MQLEEEQQEKAVQPLSSFPPLPQWPTSKPGPEVTPLPSRGKSMPTRTEQVVEVAYDMQAGVSTIRATGETTPSNDLPAAGAFNQSPQEEDMQSRKMERHKKAKR